MSDYLSQQGLLTLALAFAHCVRSLLQKAIFPEASVFSALGAFSIVSAVPKRGSF